MFVPFACAALALVTGRSLGRATGGFMVVAALASFVQCILLLVQKSDAGVAHSIVPWIEALNIQLAFRGDSFGLFFAMIVSGIGTLVGIYSCSYIPKLDPGRVGRYYAALIAFMGAMLGVALADDLILLFVFWEITSITSFMLIGFWYEKDDGRRGAMTALQVTALGGLAMMVGFVMIGVVCDTFSLSELQTSTQLQSTLAGSALFVPALLLMLAGAFTKSAQWPFHFWLPNAMVAPTPVSTYLHAATMVKAGIFLVGRMLPIFGGAEWWSPIVATAGLITFALGAYQAFHETDLKAILARTTLSTLGLVMFLYGINAASQDAVQILNHAVYKGALFLIVGIVEHATHTRDIRELTGLRHNMPRTFLLCVVAALSMAGLPPMFGFVAKESLYGALLDNEVLHQTPALQWFVIAICVLSNAFIFAVSFKIILGVFCGKPSAKAGHAHEAGLGLLFSPAVLVAIVIGVGAAAVTHGPQNLLNGFSSSTHAHAHVALIPDFKNPGPLLLSLTTIALGVGIYVARTRVGAVQVAIRDAIPTMQSLWDQFMDTITTVATAFANHWQNGSLRWYFTGTWLFVSTLGVFALYRGGIGIDNVPLSLAGAPWYGVALCGLLIIAAVAVARATTRIAAAIAITATGYLTALLFVVYRSPDIVLTQILIETVSTIFVLLILYFMPAWKPDKLLPAGRLINVVVASIVGVVMFLFTVVATSDQFRETRNLAGSYLTRAYADANGHNAVNVIIVDFRAIDTTGEITVLVVVGLLIYGLLRSRRTMT